MNPTKLNLHCTVQAWKKAVRKGIRWLDDEQEEDSASEDEARKKARDVAAELRQKATLIDIHCPQCGTAHRVATMKPVANTGGCSNAKCGSQVCGHTAPSSEWRCRCKRLWIKCPIHVHAVERITKVSRSDQPAEKHRQELGTNVPMPKKRASAKRCIQTCGKTASEVNAEFRRIRFPLLSSCYVEKFSYPGQPEDQGIQPVVVDEPMWLKMCIEGACMAVLNSSHNCPRITVALVIVQVGAH